LIEDARRDWCAIGGVATDIGTLSKYRQGESITLTQGIRQLKAAGCFTEIIRWRTRYFIPMNEAVAVVVIDQVMNLVPWANTADFRPVDKAP
jgi:hypothetical protein